MLRKPQAAVEDFEDLFRQRLLFMPAALQEGIELGGAQGDLQEGEKAREPQFRVVEESCEGAGVWGLPDLLPQPLGRQGGQAPPFPGAERGPQGLEALMAPAAGLRMGRGIIRDLGQWAPGKAGEQFQAKEGGALGMLGDPPQQQGAPAHFGQLRRRLQPPWRRRGMPQLPQEPRPVGRGKGPLHGAIVARIGHTRSMVERFSILGRGRAGRALAAAWGERVELLPHTARPEGFVLLAVPDDALADLAPAFPGRCAHLSGSLHLEGVPSLHPLTSFCGEAEDWAETPLAVTGAPPDPLVAAFVQLGFIPFTLPPEHKALYHACAVLSSGHAATLWLGAEALLAAKGITLPGRGLLPLARATLDNLQQLGAAGRTGPFVRGDRATIDRDAAALPGAWQEVFLRLGGLA